MNKEKEIFKLYQSKGRIIDNEEIIIFKEYCLDYIESCEKLRLTILGIDGYILEDNYIMVNTIEISDFSKTKEDTENCYTLAKEFINDMLNSGTSDGYIFTLNDVTTL